MDEKPDDPLSHIKCGDCGRVMDLLEVQTDSIDKSGHCWTCGHRWPSKTWA